MHDESSWFSAKLRIAVLIESVGLWEWMEVVHLFRASGFDTAFGRALALGRTHEQEYPNERGQRVRWRLARVETLNMIRDEDLDGAEVHSEFVAGKDSEEPEFDTVFDPESHTPSQTL
jgi:hypothetical protein